MSRERVRGLGYAAVGGVCGAAVTLALTGGPARDTPDAPPQPTPKPVDAPPAPLAPPAPPTLPPEGPDPSALLAALQDAQDPLSGPPPEWPSSGAFQPEAVRASFVGAFPDTEVRLECREFPCVGVIETGPDVPTALADDVAANWFPKEAYGRVTAHLEAMGLDDMTLSVTQREVEGGGYRFVVAWFAKEREAELGDRLKARFDWLAEHGLDEDLGTE